MSEESKSNPSVEEIVEEIRSSLKESDADSGQAVDEHGDENLYRTLETLNRDVGIQAPESGSGLKDRIRLKLFALLSPVFDQISNQQREEVKALNKLTRLLDGRDDDLSGEVLSSSRKRMDLIESLADRVQALEQKVKSLEGSNP